MTPPQGKAAKPATPLTKSTTQIAKEEASHSQLKKGDCKQCQGSLFVLTNENGQVRGNLCSCFTCPECGGRGQIFVEDETGISSMRECVCAELVSTLKKLNNAGIPGKFVNATFETFDPDRHETLKKALSRARDFVKEFGSSHQGLLFMGRPGLGKTHLAVAVIKALILEKGADCKFVDFFQLLSDIRHGYSQNLSEQAIINPYIHAPILVIDELAKGRNTEWELTMLDQIISSRYNDSRKITILTTNLLNARNRQKKERSGKNTEIGQEGYNTWMPKSEKGDFGQSENEMVDTEAREYQKSILSDEILQDKIGERIYSRLVEMCECITMEGMDYRQEKRGQQTTFSRTPKK